MLLAPLAARAHSGHDHGADPAAAPAAAPAAPADAQRPQRLADGSLFLPKPVQRQLGVRTQLASVADHAPARRLMGRVVADAGAGGTVQPLQAGRLLPGPRGWPQPGQRVQRGQVLALLQPALGAAERAAQQAQAAELRAGLQLARQRLDRLQQLDGSVPAKEVQAARAEVASLDGRLRAVQGGLQAVEWLRAPVAGVVSRVAAQAGEVVEARQTLFEIVDPARLRVEARLSDAAQAAALGEQATAVPTLPGGGEGGSTSGSADDSSSAWSGSGGGADGDADGDAPPAVALRRIGSGLVLEAGSLPVWFAVVPASAGDAATPPLAVGQPVTVHARLAAEQRGVVLPAAAVVRAADGSAQVYTHATAERFVPVAVGAQPLDGTRVLVTRGVSAGQRVVVQGAALLNQIR